MLDLKMVINTYIIVEYILDFMVAYVILGIHLFETQGLP